jgi:hypothetical protein|tara:strand:+ start:704 stop:847 length:144 start_codon:yes stop_codon:yes gene_type:complete
MSSTETIQSIISDFNNLDRSEKIEMIEILTKMVVKDIEKETLDKAED